MKVTDKDIRLRMAETGEPYRTAKRVLERQRRAARGERPAADKERALEPKP